MSEPAAAAVIGSSTVRSRRLMAELTRANLVAELAPGRFSMHDLLRVYAREVADATEPETERRAALGRLIDYYLHTAHRADRLIKPTRDAIPLPLATPAPGTPTLSLATYAEATNWLAGEYPALVATLRHARECKLNRQVFQLAWTVDTVAYRQGRWRDEVEAWSAARSAADSLRIPAAQAYGPTAARPGQDTAGWLR